MHARTSTACYAALVRPIFQADSGEQARQRREDALVALQERLPKVATLLAEPGLSDVLCEVGVTDTAA
jgi:hypothetical protein